jgi:hypothetical protein
MADEAYHADQSCGLDDPCELLASCPRCLYALTGLPTCHRCPECGLAFDRRWRVFGGTHMRATGRRLSPLAELLLNTLLKIVIISILVGLALRTLWPLLALPLAAGFFYRWGLRRPGNFISIGPEGLAVYGGGDDCECFEWKSVGRARRDWLLTSIVFDVKQRTVRVPIFSCFGLNVKEAAECVRAINEIRWERMTAPANHTGTPARLEV